MELKFEWDEEKERINRQKHGISFETASYVFRDEHYIEMYDFEHSIEEDRYIAIGMVGDLLFVVFTERGENIRLISARLATESERKIQFDEDSPELSPAMYKAFRCTVTQRNRKKRTHKVLL